MKPWTIETMQLGQTAQCIKTFTEADVFTFATISGDENPAHLDEAYAATTIFKSRIVHGMLVGALFSAILGTQLPGPGSIYTHQSFKFVKPVYLNDTITAVVSVKELIKEKNRAIFDCFGYNQHDELVIQGEAVIMPPKGE